jgi:hypothetical protein
VIVFGSVTDVKVVHPLNIYPSNDVIDPKSAMVVIFTPYANAKDPKEVRFGAFKELMTRFEQLLKAPTPILVTLEKSISTEDKLVQPVNKFCGIDVTSDIPTTVYKLLQLSNILPPKFVTLDKFADVIPLLRKEYKPKLVILDKFIVVKDVQLSNAYDPILVQVEGNVILYKLLHPLNAPVPIDVICVLSIFTLVKDVLFKCVSSPTVVDAGGYSIEVKLLHP